MKRADLHLSRARMCLPEKEWKECRYRCREIGTFSDEKMNVLVVCCPCFPPMNCEVLRVATVMTEAGVL